MQIKPFNWDQIFSDPLHTAEVFLTVKGGNRITMTNIVRLSTSVALLDDGPGVGHCPARELDAEILTGPSANVPTAAEMQIGIQLASPAGKTLPLPKGTFFVDTRKKDITAQGLETVKIHGFDGMLKAEKPYPESALKWPAVDSDVLQEILTDMGWTATPLLTNTVSKGYRIQYPGGYSCRETLAGIAALYGGFILLAEDKRLTFVPYKAGPSASNAGRSMNNLEAAEPLPAVSGITLDAEATTAEGEYVRYSAGDDTGWRLTAESPWASQAAADNLLTALQGYQYRPFEASAVYADPALQVGDTVTLDGKPYTIYNEDLTFGPLYRADFSAPWEEEQNHEYPYRPQTDRRIERRFLNVSSRFQVLAGEISGKVSATGGNPSSFEYKLLSTEFTLTANNKEVFRATKDGVEIDGKVTATSGLIGGWTLSKGKMYGGGADGVKVAAMQVPSAGTTWVFAAGGSSHDSYSDCPFRVNKAGEMWATNCHLSGTLDAVDGHFSGTLSANKILYSGANGYFSGSGLAGNSVTTLETSTGINTSLGFADFSDDVFGNRKQADNIGCQTITIHGRYLGIDKQVLQLYNVTIGGQKYQILAKKAV